MRRRTVVNVVQQELNGQSPLFHVAVAVARLLPDLVGNRVRSKLLAIAGVDIGYGTVIGGGIHIVGIGHCEQRLSIGQRGWINAGCYFDASERIDIGDDVAVGQQVLILTRTHELGDGSRRAGPLLSAAVRIEDGCWIGARAVILPGVTVGRGAVVAAGAVVVDDVPPHTLVGGVPARSIRALDPTGVELTA